MLRVLIHKCKVDVSGKRVTVLTQRGFVVVEDFSPELVTEISFGKWSTLGVKVLLKTEQCAGKQTPQAQLLVA